jgi:hypothetical protein
MKEGAAPGFLCRCFLHVLQDMGLTELFILLSFALVWLCGRKRHREEILKIYRTKRVCKNYFPLTTDWVGEGVKREALGRDMPGKWSMRRHRRCLFVD